MKISYKKLWIMLILPGSTKETFSEKPSNQARVGCYEVIFEDNCIGMSEEFLDRIFELFARSYDDNHVKMVQGSGLGMPISRNIVRMMGCDIKVESKLGVGSRFTVTMYLKLQETIEVQYDKFVDLDMLVADDDEINLESCWGMLNDLGMKAEGGSTCPEKVAITDNAFGEDKGIAYKAAMSWHIVKPIKGNLLMSALTEILKE